MTTHTLAFLEPELLHQTTRKISPTDISQFIRLEQCERYLRLRMHESAQGGRFLYDYGVAPQSIPPILTVSGAKFEETIMQDVANAAHMVSLKALIRAGKQPNDNQRVAELARELAPGELCFVFQPRLEANLNGWFLRGDADIIRLERDSNGDLRVMIADMKSSTSAKLEHRLQVAFYHEMLANILEEAGVEVREIGTAILYRGPENGGDPAQREQAKAWFCTDNALLEVVPSPQDYRDSVADILTSPDSTAMRVADAAFDDLPFHLNYKCDGCLYNTFCMKWSAERDDLSLLPHLHENDKKALRKHEVTTTQQLAHLKEFATPEAIDLVAAPGKLPLVRKLSSAWPLGPRLDELVHRARRYRAWQKDELRSLSFIPSKGYGSLPYSAPDHNPNLITLYIDTQADYLNDRLYLLGALLVGNENGQPARRTSVVRMAEGPPETPEQEQRLLVDWINSVIAALREVAAPDAEGKPNAPIHLVFFDQLEQQNLLDALARNLSEVLGATPLYDFMTQIAAFDSSLISYLDAEIRELKNYPILCQSLQAVASYLRFDWNRGERFREIFYRRMFDDRGQFLNEQEEAEWYTSRSRFSSSIPLEYVYVAWGQLPVPERNDEFADYRKATPERLLEFEALRLEALEHIASDFRGNRQTLKTAFSLPDITSFSGVARTLSQALAEFVTIERHVELSAWKKARLAPPERRVLAGDSLLVRYHRADQSAEFLEILDENARRRALREQFRAEYMASHPNAIRFTLTKEQKALTKESELPGPFRLRIDLSEVDSDLEHVLRTTTIRPGDRMVLAPRWDVDSRLPASEQTMYAPTPKQLLYKARADIANITQAPNLDGSVSGFVEITFSNGVGGKAPFVFGGYGLAEPEDGAAYTLDEDPNSWYGQWCAQIVDDVKAGGPNTLYQRLENPETAHVTWPASASAAQQRFLAGVDALHDAGAANAPKFAEDVRRYIGSEGDTPTLLVQGPPGTGKSYTSAFALFARLQGALAAGLERRVFLSCKTHAATDVLLGKLAELQQQLHQWQQGYPAIFAQFFDPRLLELPLFRFAPREGVPPGVRSLLRKSDLPKGQLSAIKTLQQERWCVVGITPGGVYRLLKDAELKMTGHALCQCLVLDEASQMNLPEALLAAAALAPDAQVIVVGDDRQMPPIIKHDWDTERRRTFQQYHAYESLFVTLRAQNPPMIKFAESFRLHASMAAFLRHEIYQHDDIDYFSRRTDLLDAVPNDDDYIANVLRPEYPLVVIVHDEAASQQQNPFEQRLLTPLLEVLTSPAYGLDPAHGLGIVVPHRAQRAALQDALPALLIRDPETNLVTTSAVDTVERFQGGERTVVLVSATESDREYLRAAGGFLLDPRRLNVALSRAKRKMILVASRSVFTVFSTDEETFANAQIWKNLLRRACPNALWSGDIENTHVEVWGGNEV